MCTSIDSQYKIVCLCNGRDRKRYSSRTECESGTGKSLASSRPHVRSIARDRRGGELPASTRNIESIHRSDLGVRVFAPPVVVANYFFFSPREAKREKKNYTLKARTRARGRRNHRKDHRIMKRDVSMSCQRARRHRGIRKVG